MDYRQRSEAGQKEIMRISMKYSGSVSVFLVIIPVSIMVVCSIFADAGKIKLQKVLQTTFLT